MGEWDRAVVQEAEIPSISELLRLGHRHYLEQGAPPRAMATADEHSQRHLIAGVEPAILKAAPF